MRTGLIGILMLLLALVACASDSDVLIDAFAQGHVVVEGRVTQLPSNAPVAGAQVLVGIREIGCHNPPQPFRLTSRADGSFGDRLQLLEIPGERACITFDVIPPGSTDLQRAVVTVENVRVVLTTSPPDTLRVTIALPAQ